MNVGMDGWRGFNLFRILVERTFKPLHPSVYTHVRTKERANGSLQNFILVRSSEILWAYSNIDQDHTNIAGT